MAVLLPSQIKDFNESPAEELLFSRLQELPDDYYVFHSVRWLNPGIEEMRAPQGEADFLIFNNHHGIIVLEVKGGEIRYEGRRWFQKNRASKIEKEIEDPETQASRSKFVILKAIKERLPKGNQCMVCHAVWFPDVDVPKDNLPINYVPESTLDKSSFGNTKKSIDAIFAYWKKSLPNTRLDKKGENIVINTIAPIYRVTKTLRSQLESRDRQFIRLTEQQTKIVDYLEDQKIAAIAGPAGTGKTLVALEKAKSLLNQGESVIILCYNSPLRKFIKSQFQHPLLECHTFHSLAAKYSRQENYEKSEKAFLDMLCDEDKNVSFDNVIVDEGQDYKNDWLEWIQYRTKNSFYVFYDPNQLIYLNNIPEWFTKVECRLVLKKICRSTQEVSKTAFRFIESKKSVIQSDTDGPITKLYKYSNQEELTRKVRRLLNNLLNQSKYLPHDIAILHFAKQDSALWEVLSEGKQFNFTDEPTIDNICVSTIKRFKGLEAKAIIIIGIDISDAASMEWRTQMYVGCSRAMHELHLFIENPDEDVYSDVVGALTGKEKLIADHDFFASVLESEWTKEK